MFACCQATCIKRGAKAFGMTLVRMGDLVLHMAYNRSSHHNVSKKKTLWF
jgi:hypothetical protein